MELSSFGKTFTVDAGILKLMEDLGKANSGDKDVIMLGGGNPAHIPEIQDVLRARMQKILENNGDFESLIGNYDPPQGRKSFNVALAELFRKEYGWDITEENIALTNGSQSAFFYLFNMFAGKFDDGAFKKVLLPLAPEYIGYADLGVDGDIFKAYKPKIELLENNMFKYRVNFDEFEVGDDIGAICVSRPTNPTGNVLTNDEVEKLAELAEKHSIPLILDNAYGLPFPNMVYTDAKPFWNKNVILAMSLSKFGLPGARTGIVVADKETIASITKMNAIFNLSPGSLGVSIALDIVKNGQIIDLSTNVINKYYKDKSVLAFNTLSAELQGLDYRLHKPEGAMFLWLWMKDLPIGSHELYERLKERGVVIVPGHYFFPGLNEEWAHKDECIRISYAYDEEVVRKGLVIIADEIKNIYAEFENQ